MFGMRCIALLSALFLSVLFAAAQQPTTLLVDVDHRPAMSLDGPWHYIVDPFHGGWGSVTSNSDLPGTRGYARDLHYVPGGPLQEYDFAKAPTINVPGDWNTQKENL